MELSQQFLDHTRVKLKSFEIKLSDHTYTYFPDHFREVMNDYLSYYSELILELPEDEDLSGKDVSTISLSAISLYEGLMNTIEDYFNGKLLNATTVFHETLSKCSFNGVLFFRKYNQEKTFFRARILMDRHPKKTELFHVPFEERFKIQSNRFSIPGYPALYCGGSVFNCWEEFNRYDFKKLWFSGILATKEITVLSLERVDDFFDALPGGGSRAFDDFNLLNYITTFPLILACSFKVKNPHSQFISEYIVPQLLLQYISLIDEIDGIKFPSTTINHTMVEGVDSYNYVFPVKSSQKHGHCPGLTDLFFITEPTSLETEELLYNPLKRALTFSDNMPVDGRFLELVLDEKRQYSTSSFGKLEAIIEKMPFRHL